MAAAWASSSGPPRVPLLSIIVVVLRVGVVGPMSTHNHPRRGWRGGEARAADSDEHRGGLEQAPAARFGIVIIDEII